MIEKKELVPLYNTLLNISVKGESAIAMGECLKYLQGLLQKSEIKPEESEEETND